MYYSMPEHSNKTYSAYKGLTGLKMFNLAFEASDSSIVSDLFTAGYIYGSRAEAIQYASFLGAADDDGNITPVAGGGRNASGVVISRISDLNRYAEEAFTLTKAYMDGINGFVSELVPPDGGVIGASSLDVASIDYGARPSFGGSSAVSGGWPTNSASMTWGSMPSVNLPSFPVLDVPNPSYLAIQSPSVTNIPFTATMEDVNPVSVPNAPSISLPAAPTFGSIVIPATPTINVPSFTAVLPVDNITDPAPFYFGEVAYSSGIWPDLLARVLHDINNGGTGMLPDEEDGLYQRYLDKVFAENGRMYDEATTYWSARGFTFPPGMLSSAINEINMQISRNNLQASREITINQAELRVKHNDFIIETGAKLEGMIRDFYEKNTNRTFEAAKITVENSLAIHEAMIKRHQLSIEGFKAEAAVYESVVKGSLVAVEIFKGQVEGAKVSADVQRALTEVYTAQVGAAETLMKLYVSEMEGAKIASEIELTKIEKFKVLTQAYIARMEGEKSKVDLYEAQLRGEALKADAYKAQIEAYGAKVDAQAKSNDAQLKVLDVAMRTNLALVDKYKAELSAYDSEVKAKAAEVGAVVSAVQAEVSAYAAKNGASESYYKAKVEEIRAQVSVADFNLKKAVAEIESTTKGYVAIKELQLKGAEGIMNVGAQLTASALNAVNVGASIGSSDSTSSAKSDSTSVSKSTASSSSRSSSSSNSSSHSTSTNYNYDMTDIS